MNTGLLHRIFLNNSNKLIHKWIHYFDIYEKHLSRFIGKAPVVLEIGVYKGGSLAMWQEYFGQGTHIIGIDINSECRQHQADNIEIYIGSQDDPQLLEKILKKNPHIDIIIDDGSHVMKHMIDTFNTLYYQMSTTGVYIVEDTHTCYWPEYGGGLKANPSFLEFTKDKIDELNAVHTRGVLPVSAFTKSTDCIALYDSMVVFERRPQGHRLDVKTQAMQDSREAASDVPAQQC